MGEGGGRRNRGQQKIVVPEELMPPPTQLGALLVVLLPHLEGSHLGAQGAGGVAVVIGGQGGGPLLKPPILRRRHARRHGGPQQVLVGLVRLLRVEVRPRLKIDCSAAIPKGGGDLLDPQPHFGLHWCCGVIRPNRHFQILKGTAGQGRQLQAAAPRSDGVRPGHDLHRSLQVRRATGQRPDDGDVRCAAHVPRRRMAAHPQQAPSGFVAEDAAEVRRVANRAADVGTCFQAHKASGQRRRRAARGAARNALQVVGVVGDAIDFVVALKVR